MKLTENFTRQEFDCKNGIQVPVDLLGNVQVLAQQLQILRDHLGEPIHINSGYRTPDYNASVGGKPKSQHLQAKAADITVKSKSPKQLAAYIEKLITAGTLKFGGMGLYKGFVHVDIRKNKARWVG